jgi:hypothetical protein
MPTYNLTKGSATTPVMSVGTTNRSMVFVENVLDISKMVSDAGVAAGDVVQMLDIPAETDVWMCGMEVITALTGTSPDIDLGITGTDVDEWVDGNDGTAGYATQTAWQLPIRFASTDTIDLLFNTNAATAGVIRVFAWLADVSGASEAMTASDSQQDTAV